MFTPLLIFSHENIRQIEAAFQVNVANRGTELKISGEEEAADQVSLRVQGEGDKGSMTLDEFCNHVNDLVKAEIASQGHA